MCFVASTKIETLRSERHTRPGPTVINRSRRNLAFISLLLDELFGKVEAIYAGAVPVL